MVFDIFFQAYEKPITHRTSPQPPVIWRPVPPPRGLRVPPVALHVQRGAHPPAEVCGRSVADLAAAGGKTLTRVSPPGGPRSRTFCFTVVVGRLWARGGRRIHRLWSVKWEATRPARADPVPPKGLFGVLDPRPSDTQSAPSTVGHPPRRGWVAAGGCSCCWTPRRTSTPSRRWTGASPSTSSSSPSTAPPRTQPAPHGVPMRGGPTRVIRSPALFVDVQHGFCVFFFHPDSVVFPPQFFWCKRTSTPFPFRLSHFV